ncbi:Phosphatidylserine decarboxylase [Cronobacter universalis NCTC 9529]|nr:Phosphatidylserine decarboxylase [Cronobacter universalis NCTC 9529]
MGRFKLGSTVINLFAPGKVELVEHLQSLSVTRLGEPLAVSVDAVVADVAPAVISAEEAEAERDANPLVDNDQDR